MPFYLRDIRPSDLPRSEVTVLQVRRHMPRSHGSSRQPRNCRAGRHGCGQCENVGSNEAQQPAMFATGMSLGSAVSPCWTPISAHVQLGMGGPYLMRARTGSNLPSWSMGNRSSHQVAPVLDL